MCLRHNGYLYLEMPGYPFHKRMLPKKLFKKLDGIEEVEHVGDRYSLNDLQAMVRLNGFQVVQSGYIIGPIAEFVCQIDMILNRYFFMGSLCLLPLLRLLAFLDFGMRRLWKKGHIWVLAKKDQTNI